MRQFTSADGLRLAYRDEEVPGDAAGAVPLICLAGLTRNATDFDWLMPHLPPMRVIRPDYRGRGGSEFADPATYTVAAEAADVLALMDHLGVGRAAILGTSRGGLIAMLLAATQKHRLAGVCLNDIGPELDARGLGKIKGYVGRPPAFATQEEMAEAMPRLFPEFRDVPPERWRAQVQRHTRQTPQGLALSYDPRLAEALAGSAAPAADLWPLFDALEGLPLALIRGANSDLLAPETVQRMQARRPDMIVAEVPGRGHVPFLDEPEALGAIHAFLKEI